ncbi:MAG TPA: NlpC/P60 family protein [Chitinophagales bacterium]|nr:NlpC/P60 family protein [Chitinophagales bacterium]
MRSSAKEPEIATSKKDEFSQIKVKYGALLNVNEKQIKNANLYLLIDDWYGTRYKYGGCDKNGVDCSNFVSIIYQQVYHTFLKGSSASIFGQCKPVNKNELKEGDLVFFKIENKHISHIGMYLQNNKFVHATTKKGVMINDLDEPYYAKYFYKAGRFRSFPE